MVQILCILSKYINLDIVLLCSDREAVQELDARLKEERKQAGEKVIYFDML